MFRPFASAFRLVGLSGRGIPLLRVRGIPIEAHWSLIASFIWFPFVLAPAYRDYLPDLSASTVTAMTLASVVLLHVSVILHELGHGLQARREGMGIDRVLLWAIGGLAYIRNIGRWSPGADLRITAAGPLVTLVLAIAFTPPAFLAATSGWPDPLVGILAFLAWMNCSMLVFNLLPVFPLDGGRLLHATLWRVLGFTPAAAWTTRVGLAVAGALLAAGAVLPFLVDLPPFTGFFAMFNAALLLTAAYAIRPPSELRYLTMRGRAVGDLLTPQPVIPDPDTAAETFLSGLTSTGGQAAAAYPVARDGKVVGVVSPGLAAEAAVDGRTVGEAMVRKERAVMLTPEMSIEEAYSALEETPAGVGVVLYDGRAVGILTRANLADAVLEAQEAEHGYVVPASPPKLTMDW